MMEDTEVIRGLAALAQPLRLQVFRALVVVGEAGLTPGAIQEALGVAPATLSFHLKELVASGLVTQERARPQTLSTGRTTKHMNALLGYLTQNCCLGADCVRGKQLSVLRLLTPPSHCSMLNNSFNVLFVCTGNRLAPSSPKA